MAVEIGKALVQIVPSAQGIKGSIEGVLGGEADSAGKSAGMRLASGLKKVIAAAGVGVAIKKSLEAGGALQQSFGGVETLYGDAADAVKNYANEAYKAGISANSYAEQAVSFGASLKQAFGGDTTKSMEAANTAIMDMADNAAKMGTPLENIQNAYQGFAKQNYTMLDNLKLGYGGTKSEMERLLADAEKLSGKEYDISNLGDVYDAIHVIQEDLGLTGVAADEAATTFTGSFGAMKASAENLLADLMLGENVGPAMEGLVTSTITFLAGNLLPAVGNIFASLPTAIGTAISVGLPLIGEQAANLITSLTNGINTKIPELAAKLPGMVQSALDSISSAAPQAAAKGLELLQNLGQAIVDNAPALASAAASAIQSFVSFLGENLPAIAAKGGELIGSLAEGFITNLPRIAGAVLRIGAFILQNMASIAGTMIRAGLNVVRGIANGIKSGIGSAITGAMNKIKEAITKPIQQAKDKVKEIMDKIKGIFPLSIGRIFSNLKIPHISVSGGKAPFGIGGLGTKPSINVTWGAKGGILDGATLIGAGEAGKEALLPLDRNTQWMDDLADRINGAVNTFNISMTVDGAENPEQYAQRFARELRRQVRMGAV